VPKYDLTVVGAGLGGLAAAALAARRGRKTIVLEPGDSAGGVLDISREDGFVFSPGPHLSFGFERDGTIQKLGESLGIALNASLCSPCYQVALPDRRITVYAEHSETLDELRREFAHEIDSIAKFYRDLRTEASRGAKGRISAFLLKRKTAARFIRRYRFSREFTAFLDAQSLYFFRRRAADLSLLSLITLCDTAPFEVHGGFKKIAEQMVDVILKNKGEIRYHVPFSEITFREGRITVPSTPPGTPDGGVLLLNTEQHKQGTMLFLGIRGDVVPTGMLQYVLCLADYSRMEDLFTVSISAKDDVSAAPKGMSTLAVSCSSLSARLTKNELMRQVGTVIPFLNDFVVLEREHEPASRVYAVPEGMSFKTIRMPDSQAYLSRSSMGNVYMLGDGSGTPAQEIAAAQAFVARLK
jgi:phytoene dehydrogenase-like protein